MIILKPIADERVWGGSRLKPLLNEEHERIGHLYSCISNHDLVTEIMNGRYKGKTIEDYFVDNKDRLGLSMFKHFPIVIAMVDARENLSIQVHPDDDTIKQLENETQGKNESWYFIKAPTSGSIINGCRCKDKNELKILFERGDYEQAVDTVAVKEGDYLYCEAGTLHALTTGCLTYEIEENRDYTYRFFDYNRLDSSGNPRKMQMEKALISLDVGKKSLSVEAADKTFEHRGYSFQLINNADSYKNESTEIQIISMINGSALIDGIKFSSGMSVILEPTESICGDFKTIGVVQVHSF